MKTIVCYGDSNTWGHDPADGSRLPYGTRWTSVLQTLLGGEYLVCEEGMNGRTTVFDDPIEPHRSGLAYLEPCLIINKPVDLVIFMLGTNDVKTYLGQTPLSIQKGIERLILTAQDPQYGRNGKAPEILVASPVELYSGPEHSWLDDYFDERSYRTIRELKERYREMAELHGCFFMAASDYAQASPTDKCHLDAENHEKLAHAFYARVREILG